MASAHYQKFSTGSQLSILKHVVMLRHLHLARITCTGSYSAAASRQPLRLKAHGMLCSLMHMQGHHTNWRQRWFRKTQSPPVGIAPSVNYWGGKETAARSNFEIVSCSQYQ